MKTDVEAEIVIKLLLLDAQQHLSRRLCNLHGPPALSEHYAYVVRGHELDRLFFVELVDGSAQFLTALVPSTGVSAAALRGRLQCHALSRPRSSCGLLRMHNFVAHVHTLLDVCFCFARELHALLEQAQGSCGLLCKGAFPVVCVHRPGLENYIHLTDISVASLSNRANTDKLPVVLVVLSLTLHAAIVRDSTAIAL